MRLSFTARTPGVTSAACTHRSMMALGSICGFRRFQFFAQRQRPQPNPPSSASASRRWAQSINPFRMAGKILGASATGRRPT
jgi:hypothetical protein